MAHRSRGISLLETMVVLTVIASASAAALSFTGDFLRTLDVRGAAAEVASDLQFVRSEAVARNESLVVSFMQLEGGGSCYAIHTGADHACTCGASGPATCEEGAQEIKTVRFAPSARVGVHSRHPHMRFDPVFGTVSPGGSVSVLTDDGRAVRHVVSIMGRLRSCSPDGAMLGYPQC